MANQVQSPAQPPAQAPAEPEPTEQHKVAEQLVKLGYTMVKAGACNVPGFRQIQTWIKRSGPVYLIWNEAGQWDLLQTLFFGDPTVEGIAEALSAK